MSIGNGNEISASVIEHSVNSYGDELITIQTKAPKYLDAECITGDTLLHFKRMQLDGTYKLITNSVFEVFLNWGLDTNQDLSGLLGVDIDLELSITSDIIDIWESGYKDVYKLTTKYGSITTSENHLFLTDTGWKKSKDLNIDLDLVRMVLNGIDSYYKIESIEFIDSEMTYDLQVSHKDSNFVANGFVIHNCEKHRMISSNSSSDRAIPFNKLKNREFYIPDDVRLNERGMQGYENVSNDDLIAFKGTLSHLHATICDTLTPHANIHKQHLNRYLIGYTLQDKVMTANRDQWDYFLSLRLGTDADPAIQELSRHIDNAINNSVARLPQDSLIHPNIPYHLPYITVLDMIEYDNSNITLNDLIKVSVARCARVSYLTHDRKNTNVIDDIKLYNFLLESKHFSPFEMVAIEMTPKEHESRQKCYDILVNDGLPEILANQVLYNGNFKGWVQHRKEIFYEG